MWTSEIFGYAVGAALIVVAIIGGGMELSGTKVPKIDGKARYALAALGAAFLVASFLLLRNGGAVDSNVSMNDQDPPKIVAGNLTDDSGVQTTPETPIQETTDGGANSVTPSTNESVDPIHANAVVATVPVPQPESRRVRLTSPDPMVRVRAGGGTRYGDLAPLPSGSIVVARREGYWWRIELGHGQVGYVHRSSVDPNVPQ